MGIERGATGFPLCSLKLSSAPAKADVYLVPSYIWDMGDNGQAPPSKFNDVELRDYLKKRFDFWEGETALDKQVIEQNYVAIFLLRENLKRISLKLLLGDNSASVSFEQK